MLYDEAAIPGRHTIQYRVRDSHRNYPEREVEVLATPEEIGAFVRDGYLVRERLVPMDQVERLRAALEETVAREGSSRRLALGSRQGQTEDHAPSGPLSPRSAERREPRAERQAFGGVFLRHMSDKHPLFLQMLNFPPAVSVARALFGPFVQMRGFTGRVCRPGDPHETVWHFHQRLVPEPLPPMFSRPQSMDVLIYLDDIDDENGPLCVLPGSHNRLNEDLEASDFEEKPGQVILRLPAGSCVLAHGALWHRALPTPPGGRVRRLLLFGYGPGWMKPSIYGKKPEDGLTAKLLETPDLDEETRELLGIAGYM